MGRPAINEEGNRYGRLVVVKRDDTTPIGRPRWVCQCDCGKTVIVRAWDLRSGDTTSCGCLRAENMAKTAAAYREALKG
jgi:hypothetical protein